MPQGLKPRFCSNYPIIRVGHGYLNIYRESKRYNWNHIWSQFTFKNVLFQRVHNTNACLALVQLAKHFNFSNAGQWTHASRARRFDVEM